MKTMQLKDLKPRTPHTPYNEIGWIWTHLGYGALYAVLYVRADGWAVCHLPPEQTFTRSFCCIPSETVYLYDSEEERVAHEHELKVTLADARSRY